MVPVATCSSVITVEPVSATGQPATFNGTITLTSESGVAFFADANCTMAQTTLVIDAARPRAEAYVGATTPGSFTVAASSMPSLAPASQGLTVSSGPDTLSFSNTPPLSLKAGACFPMAIQSSRAGTPLAPSTPVTVNLSAVLGAARFYADPSCDVEISSVLHASTTSTVFVRALSSPLNRLRAARPLWIAGEIPVAALPMVRRDTCTFSAQMTNSDGGPGPVQTGLTCMTLTPSAVPLNSAIFYQSITSSLSYPDGHARCRFADQGARVTCARGSGVQEGTVHVQVIEDPSRLRVATYDGQCTGASNYALSGTVNLDSSFLVRGKFGSSTNYDEDETAVFAFADAGLVAGFAPNTCGTLLLQAVEWRGTRVVRGALDGGMDAGTTLSGVSMLPAASTNTALLVQSGTATDGLVNICSVLVRGTLRSSTEIEFSRAMNTPSCATGVLDHVRYERIDFQNQARVQQLTATLPMASASTSVPLSPAVDPTRTIVFASGQQDFGQAGGETSLATSSIPHVAGFILELNAAGTSVTVRRGRTIGPAMVTFYVVQAE
jgi:hypothetical protein